MFMELHNKSSLSICSSQMLVVWLLFLPLVRATIQCHSACGLCAMDNNMNTASCVLCRECHKVHRRKIKRREINILSNKEKNELKDLEKREFKEVLKEYGFKAEDLVDSKNKLVKKLKDDSVCMPPPSKCINDPEYADEVITGTKFKLEIKAPTSSTCPPVPNCQTEPETLDYEYEYVAGDTTKQTVTQPPTTTSTTTCKPKILVKKKVPTCVPCMPMCPLPCNMALPQSSILPSIPKAAMDALMTLGTTTEANKELMHTPKPTEDEEQLKLLLKQITTKSTISTIDTTKDYVYLYVGIPKGINVRRG